MIKILDIETREYKNYCQHFVKFIVGSVNCEGFFTQFHSDQIGLKEIINRDVKTYGVWFYYI